MPNPITQPSQAAREAEKLIDELRTAAQTSSALYRRIAEEKSLRQPDNADGRVDLYDWPKPEQTLEGRAADFIEKRVRERLAGEANVERVAVLESRKKLTPEYLAMTPLQKWETLTLHGLLGTDEPWIEDMRAALATLERTTDAG